MCLAIPGKVIELFPGFPYLATVEVGGVRPPYGVIDVFLTAEQHRMGRLQNWVVENLPKDQGHTTVCLTQPVELLTFRPLMHSPTSRMLVRHAR